MISEKAPIPLRVLQNILYPLPWRFEPDETSEGDGWIFDASGTSFGYGTRGEIEGLIAIVKKGASGHEEVKA